VETDRNLLFGVLALQAGLIESNQFVEACTLWSTRKNVPLADILVERSWILPIDVAHVEYLLGRYLRKFDNDPKASLATVDDTVKRLLATVNDAEIRNSLATLRQPETRDVVADVTATVDLTPAQRQHYSLSRLHATGGIGRIWVAHDADLGRDIALKELRPEMAESAALRARFLREARITGQLEHPGIVPVYELGRQPDNQQPFYTMRLVKGRTLTEAAHSYHEKRLGGQADSLQLLALLNAFVTVCNTIAYAHSRGIVHRDLKGQNVVLGDFGEVVVLDWGLAKLVDRPDEEQDTPPILPDRSREADLTLQGQTVGTPAYMAPEQAAGRLGLIDHRTDVYGLGALLYEILTGQPPFKGSDTHEVLRRVLEEAPVPPRQLWEAVPPRLEMACLRAMAKKPKDRYFGATELAQEVETWQEVQRRQAEEERDRFFTLSLDMLCIAGSDGYFKRLNPAFEGTLGYTIHEMLAEPFLSFVHPDDREATLTEMQRIVAGVDTISFENRYRCKDGSYKWMLWTARQYSENRLIYAAARDITERKRAEEALRESEERYRSAIAAMQDGIVVLDADGGIRACNGSAELILGLSADQMRGRTPLDPRWRAVHEDGSPFPGETHPSMITLRTGKPCSNVVMGVHKPNGALTWILINSQPLFGADWTTLTGVAVSFSDITHRRQTEEKLRQVTVELAHAKQQCKS